jgi:hypothetical protein
MSRTPLKIISTQEKIIMANDVALMRDFMQLLFRCIDHRLQQMVEHVTHFLGYYLDRLSQPPAPDPSALPDDSLVRSGLDRVFGDFIRFQAPRGSIYKVITLVSKAVRRRWPAGVRPNPRAKKVKRDTGGVKANIT